MAKVKIQGHASGSGVLTITAPNTSTDRTVTLPDSTGTLLNSDGDGSSLTGVNAVNGGRKNLIINGGMQIAQRGTSTTSGAQAYLLDRFYTYQFNASGRTVSQSTDSPDEFSNSLKVIRAANNTATTSVYLSQPIESKNCVGTAGKKITFSFWAKKGANWSASGGTFPVTVTSGTGSDQSFMAGVTGGVTLINSSATLTTSWAKYSFTSSAIVPTNSTQLIYQTIAGWAGTAGADDSFYITGIQLEIGETATDFEHRSYGEELALCHRYFQAISFLAAWGSGIGKVRSSGQAFTIVQFLTTMRAIPSTITSPTVGQASGNITYLNGENYPSTHGSINANEASVDSCWFNLTGFSAIGSVGDATWAYANGTAIFYFDAEL